MDRESSVRFGQYLQSVIKIKELEKMTDELNEELLNSQRIMSEIKTIFATAPTNHIQIESNSGVQNDIVYTGLAGSEPNLLMNGMDEFCGQQNLENLESAIEEMKSYAEDIQKQINKSQPIPEIVGSQNNIEGLNNDCVILFDQLRKRLDTIKTNEVVNKQNKTRLTQLCQELDIFIQKMQAHSVISQSNGTESVTLKKVDDFQFMTFVKKLLSGLNEVIYLLQKKN